MSDTIIKVEGLGKKYSIRHQQEGRQYKALRDVIADGAKSLARPLMGKGQNVQNPSREDFWALKDVNFEIKQGDRVGIIGRNGAGKSTLLKVLSRIVEPTEGRISIKGRVASLLEVGTGFHPELTGRENIYLNGAILGMGKAEIKRKFDEIVDFAEVERFLDTPVKRYSSGMYVRLAFAVAAHLEPEILIVDEVLAVGDAQFQKKCLGKMEDVGKEGRTVLFVSHNMQAIEQLCSNGLLLSHGSLFSDDSIGQVMHSYYQMVSENSLVHISKRSDRKGNGRIRFTNVKIQDERGIETERVRMGDTFKIILELEGCSNDAILGIGFGNSSRKYLVRSYTHEQLSKPINCDSTHTIECEFTDLYLMHGLYDIHLTAGTYPPYEAFDHVEYATSIEILPTDYFSTGRIPDPHGGVFVCKSSWHMDGESLT